MINTSGIPVHSQFYDLTPDERRELRIRFCAVGYTISSQTGNTSNFYTYLDNLEHKEEAHKKQVTIACDFLGLPYPWDGEPQ